MLKKFWVPICVLGFAIVLPDLDRSADDGEPCFKIKVVLPEKREQISPGGYSSDQYELKAIELLQSADII